MRSLWLTKFLRWRFIGGPPLCMSSRPRVGGGGGGVWVGGWGLLGGMVRGSGGGSGGGADGGEVRLRVDGLLELVGRHDADVGRSIVARLMVMAHLLTYRLDIPQEGRMKTEVEGSDAPLELRLAIMPTTHGLRAAIRMPA